MVRGVGAAIDGVMFAGMREAETPARVQCEAVTKSGTQCKRKALSGGKLCRQHQKIADKKAKSE